MGRFTRTGGGLSTHLVAALALSLTLVGCSAATTPAPTASPQATTALKPPEDDDVSAAPAPVWDAAAKSQAADIAEKAVAAFVDHNSPQSSWIAKLRPYLSFNAAQAYATVDPSKIVGTRVTGPARITDTSSVYLGTFAVPTDAGDYVVLVQRTDAASPLLVERITLGGAP